MAAIILDGRKVAAKNELELSGLVSQIPPDQPRPCLATIIVGDNSASKTYVRMKRAACTRVGIQSIAVELPATTTTHKLVEEITRLNRDAACHGILLQHPVPAHIDELRCFDAIAPEKDVDGVTALSFARLTRGLETHVCATPKGILRLLQAYEIPLAGLNAVVVGRSPILGTPMAALLTRENATVTLCHSHTRDLRKHVQQAELVVVGIGRPAYIPGAWLADQAVVVDAGYNPGPVGDIDLDESARQRCHAYTPVPGGVGPMTINTLLNQTLTSCFPSGNGTASD